MEDNENKARDEGSVCEEENPRDQVFYDASDKLDEFQDYPQPITIKMHNEKEIEVPIDWP